MRAVCDNVVLAVYHCRYDLREGKVKDRRDGSFHPTRFASSQGVLIPRYPHEALGLYCPKSLVRHVRVPLPIQPLWLFERAGTVESGGRGHPVSCSPKGQVVISVSKHYIVSAELLLY